MGSTPLAHIGGSTNSFRIGGDTNISEELTKI